MILHGLQKRHQRTCGHSPTSTDCRLDVLVVLKKCSHGLVKKPSDSAAIWHYQNQCSLLLTPSKSEVCPSVHHKIWSSLPAAMRVSWKKRFAIEKKCAQIAMEKTWDGLWKPVYPNFAIDSWDAQFRKPRSCNHWKTPPRYVVKHLGGKFLHRDTPVLRVEDLGTHTQRIP